MTTIRSSDNSALLPPDHPASHDEQKGGALGFSRYRLLFGAYAVLFIRYCIATFLSSFFTPVATQLGISGSFNGLIFAAYPAGMAMTSLVAPQAIQLLGTRLAVVLGLSLTSVFTIAFGLVPDLAAMGGGEIHAQTVQWLFLLCYFVNGLTGALAETACIIMVSNKFEDKLGVIMASIGTVSGVGCMIGPVVGGVLYDIMPDNDAPPPTWAFRVPFLVCGVLPLFLLPPLPLYMPNSHLSFSSKAAPFSSVLSLSVVLGLLSVALSGTFVATLDPTLSYRLSAPPFRLSASWVSLFFMYSSVVYTLISIPVGWLVDRFPGNSRIFKLTTGIGFLCLALTFGLLAPFGLSAWNLPPAYAHGGLETALNNMPCTATAMVLKGFGSAFSNNAVYPDLVIGLPEDNPMLQATISGLWNAAYAAGWALGPLVGGVLYDAFQTNSLCVGKDALSPNCPDTASPHHASPPPPPGEGPGCSCEWQPANGFDGFGTAISLACVVYAAVLFVAAALNVRGKSVQLLTRLPPPPTEPTLAPLDARRARGADGRSADAHGTDGHGGDAVADADARGRK